MPTKVRDYYRGDQPMGISPPDLAKQCSFSEHIVRARGKRTQYTSVSRDPECIRRFGETLYLLLRDRLTRDGHALVEHEALMQALRKSRDSADRANRQHAAVALHYCRRWQEGLVDWKFDTAGVEPKDLIDWARQQVRPYFTKA